MSVSQERLDKLSKRIETCCCKYCGGELEVRLLDFGKVQKANIEVFCTDCNRIEYGVPKEIYQDAVYFVDHIGFDCYPDRDKTEATRKLNIGKVCEILDWHDKRLGILNESGYQIPLQQHTEEMDRIDGSIIIEGAMVAKDEG